MHILFVGVSENKRALYFWYIVAVLKSLPFHLWNSQPWGEILQWKYHLFHMWWQRWDKTPPEGTRARGKKRHGDQRELAHRWSRRNLEEATGRENQGLHDGVERQKRRPDQTISDTSTAALSPHPWKWWVENNPILTTVLGNYWTNLALGCIYTMNWVINFNPTGWVKQLTQMWGYF